MEKIFNSKLRNLGEYNTRNEFNSSSDPISIEHIANMVEDLKEDINNFKTKIINNSYYELINSQFIY